MRNILSISIFSLVVGMFAINKFWFPYDDGIALTSSELILRGEVPYKDFIIQYTPLQYYIIAFLFKVFGVNHLVARFYIVVLYMGITGFAFYAAREICRDIRIAYLCWAVCAVSLVPRLGTNLSVTWLALALAYGAIFSFYMYAKMEKGRYLAMSGLLSGLTFLAKQDMGAYVFASGIGTSIVLSRLSRTSESGQWCKNSVKRIVLYSALAAVFPAAYAGYIFKAGSLSSFINSILIPVTTLAQHTAIQLPRPCLDLRQIFHGSLNFITINQFYLPILTYILAGAIWIRSIGREENRDTIRINVFSFFLLSFGIMSYYFVLFRADDMHLMFIIPTAAILLGYIYKEYRSSRIVLKMTISLLLFLFVLLIVKNSDKFLKNALTKPLSGKIIEYKNERGAIYIPLKEYGPVTELIEYIQEKASGNERILVWQKGSAKPWQGTELLIYFFSKRLPATKYFIVLPGYTNRESIQREVVNSLERSDLPLVVLVGEKEEGRQIDRDDEGLIDAYVNARYRLMRTISYFSVYIKKASK